jgi:hypothetical protein
MDASENRKFVNEWAVLGLRLELTVKMRKENTGLKLDDIPVLSPHTHQPKAASNPN